MKNVNYDAIINLLIKVWKNEPLDGHSHKNCWQLAGIIERKFPDINYAELKRHPETFHAPLAMALEELDKTDVVAQILIRNLTGGPGKTDGAGSVIQQVNNSGDGNKFIIVGGHVENSFNTQPADAANKESRQKPPVAENNGGMNPTGLQVFLCHASEDKPRVVDLYNLLSSDGFSPWLDVEELLPGDQWDLEIKKTIKRIDAVIVCLSNNSINKRGYVQKEITMVLDAADEIPEGKPFIFPLKLEECEIPDRLSKWQSAYFNKSGYEKLAQALRRLAAKGR